MAGGAGEGAYAGTASLTASPAQPPLGVDPPLNAYPPQQAIRLASRREPVTGGAGAPHPAPRPPSPDAPPQVVMEGVVSAPTSRKHSGITDDGAPGRLLPAEGVLTLLMSNPGALGSKPSRREAGHFSRSMRVHFPLPVFWEQQPPQSLSACVRRVRVSGW